MPAAGAAIPDGWKKYTEVSRDLQHGLISQIEQYTDRDEKVSPGKLHATQYIVVLVLVALAAGMWRLQVLGVDSYRMLAEANRVRKHPVTAPRGKIFDREGRILVDNYPSVSCFLLREQVKDLNADIPLIGAA